MITFVDGPAAGKNMLVKRAPIYLRVVRGLTGQIDCLDQEGDIANVSETLFAYFRVSYEGNAHMSRTDSRTGKRMGGFYPIAKYQYIETQPDDTTMRNHDLWVKWVNDTHADAMKANEDE